MIRDAQPARLRALLGVLREIDGDARVTADAADLMDCEPGALVLLLVLPIDLDWLNINRPIIAQRSLRLVLWTEAAVSDRLKFESPDLHDWVSHFIKCPPGVPQFAAEGLRIGARWWPGVAWRGGGLELALAELDIEVETLEPDSAFAGLVETLRANPAKSVCWVGVDSLRELWRVRWAVAEARHCGFCVLDNPRVSAPGWFPVDSRQYDLASALTQHDGMLEAGIEAEFEPEDSAGEEVLRDVGLLLHPGLRLRSLHESADVVAWRRKLVAAIRKQPNHAWSRHELAIFASLERDRRGWPSLTNGESQQRHFVEWSLRHEPSKDRRLGWMTAARLADIELSTHWTAGDTAWVDVDVVQFGNEIWSPPSREQWSKKWDWDSLPQFCQGVGWDAPFCIRAASIVLSNHIDDSTSLAQITPDLQAAVEGELGQDDAVRVQYVYMINISRALAGDPWSARDEIETLTEHAVQHPAYALPVYAAIRVLCGDYQASAEFLRKLSLEDPLQIRLYLEALLAAGQPKRAKAELQRLLAIDAEPREYLGPESNAKDLARELLLAQLQAY
ncbi:hypothetical protein ENSA7_71210 [Enhygromyxa salina]|uniref:Uncharacterized protein n=2 Tax=Enhygromyxa salina TaxID=215803 RepID=A0A2S9XTW1_9BACT|nr:hypothetical protein ENSA7_71210 [Enhygromyxa salina]